MKNFSRIFLFVLISASLASARQISYASETIDAGAETRSSVAVTVYNQNLSLVRDVRKTRLEKAGELRFMDVPSTILPETVHVKAVKNPESFRLLEQNYEYDLMSAEKILDKYEGKKVKLVNWNEYQDRQNTTEATLLSNSGQIYRVGDEIYLGYPGYKVVSEIPNNLIARPTLTWSYENSGSAEQELEVSYLASNLGWNADYVLVVDEEKKIADLSGWVTLNNESGASFENAKLKLVAGELNIVPRMAKAARMNMAMEMSAQGGGFEERSFFEYHLYALDRPTTIKNNQTKQISLLQAPSVRYEKEYLCYGQEYFYIQRYEGQPQTVPVEVVLHIENSKENGLGMPLPAGTVRLYQKDKDGSAEFAGEDHIPHRPANEKLRLKVGKAFDLVCERVQKDYKLSSSTLHESVWEITIRNRKAEDVTIGLIEPMGGQWKITENSHPFQQIDARSARFDVSVPKNGQTKVIYRVSNQY